MKLTTPTAAESTIAAIQSEVDASLRQVHAAVAHLRAAYQKLWSLPDAELVAVLNHLGPAQVVAMFNNHATHGAALNALLDTAGDPSLSKRVVLEPGKTVVWDAEAETFVVIPPEPEDD